MILIGRLMSPYTRRVAMVLRVLRIDYELDPISVAEQEKLRTLNPLGRVPALQLDSGEVLVDSLAIVDHLTEEAGPGQTVLPRAGVPRRRVLQATMLISGALEKVVAGYYERTRKPAEKIHPPFVAACNDQARSALAALENTCAGTWLASDAGPSLADIALATAFDFFAAAAPEIADREALPRLHRIADRVRAMPEYAATTP